jgi:hypothetical protein
MRIPGTAIAITIAIATLLATSAQAREPNVKGFKSYAMPTYTLVTPDAGNAQHVPWPVVQSQAVLEKLFNREASAPSAPTYVFLMPVSVWRRYLQPGQGLNSEFVPGRFANYLLVCNTQYEVELRNAMLHESTHWNLHNQLGGFVPLWFDEGLAQIIEGANFFAAEVALGRTARPFQGVGGWIPMAELLVMDKTSSAYLNLDSNALVRAKTWALVHRGLIFDEKFGKQMFAFIAAQNALEPLDAAVQSSFGMTLRELDRDISSYNSKNVQLLRLDMTPAPVPALPPGRAMGEAESIEFIGEIMLASGFKSTRLPEIADALLRVPQGKSGESALRMRIAARDGDDATLTRLSGAIDQKNSDPTLLRGAGLALFERAADSRRGDQSVRALEFLDRALRVRPDDAEAAWAYGMLAAGLKRDLPAALERVAVTRSRLPANPHLARAAALLHEAAGDTSEMNQALQDALRLSKTPEMSAWAKQRLQ